jgi:hypothetical protein
MNPTGVALAAHIGGASGPPAAGPEVSTRLSDRTARRKCCSALPGAPGAAARSPSATLHSKHHRRDPFPARHLVCRDRLGRDAEGGTELVQVVAQPLADGRRGGLRCHCHLFPPPEGEVHETERPWVHPVGGTRGQRQLTCPVAVPIPTSIPSPKSTKALNLSMQAALESWIRGLGSSSGGHIAYVLLNFGHVSDTARPERQTG